MLTSHSLSANDKISVLLKRGLVVKIKGDLPFDSDHYHRFVILNHNPDTGSIIFVTHATHQVEEECVKAQQQGEDVNKTVVYFKPNTYKFFPKPTVFNCNEVDQLAFQDMVKAMESGNLEIPPDDVLTEADLQKLVDGALASTQITPIIAAQLLDQE